MGLPSQFLTAAHNAARRAESRLFDWTRRVQTHGDVTLEQAGILPEHASDSKRYVPARAANIREALRSIPKADPKADLSRSTFIDLGSGKGRGLFVAAEFSFHRILGVEFSASLHETAVRNKATFRYRGRDGSRILPLHQDATAFPFPDGPLVLYQFNPFGPITMGAVLDNLRESLAADPRPVVLILLWPLHGDLVLRIPGMRLLQKNRRYEMYGAHPSAPQAGV